MIQESLYEINVLPISFLLYVHFYLSNENIDLSKEIYPTDNVKVEILEKIEQLEKDG